MPTHKNRTEKSKDDWETPSYFYNLLDKEFHFTLDPCSSDLNHKTEKYFTEKENGLCQSWRNETVFVNPPFSEKDIWLEKAYNESLKGDTVIVMIVPSTTDTQAWHQFAMRADEIWFCNGRVNFDLPRLFKQAVIYYLKKYQAQYQEISALLSPLNIDASLSKQQQLFYEETKVLLSDLIKASKKELSVNSATFPLSIIVYRSKPKYPYLKVSTFNHKKYKENPPKHPRITKFLGKK